MKKVYLLVIALLATLWASATIVQGTIGNGSYTSWDNTTSTQYGIDFNNDGTLEFKLAENATYLEFNWVNGGTNIWVVGNVNQGDWDVPQVLANGTSIGSNGNWEAQGDCSLAGWGETPNIPVGQNVFIGFRIKLSDGTHYGWGKVSISGSGYEYTANWQGVYYETTPNTPISAGSTGGGVTPTTYTIAVSANPAAAGTVYGGGSYEQGASVTVSATANTGYTFTNWTENGSVVSTNANYTFSATANRTLVANFQENSTPSDTYTVITYANPSNGGYTIGEWDDVHGTFVQFPAGSVVTLEAVAYTGYTFTSWTENTADGAVVSTSAVYTFTINSNRVLYANFTYGGSENTVSINATANPTDGGTIQGAGNYEYGSFVTLTATANPGYTFVNWTENGVTYSNSPTYTFSAFYNRNLVANFESNSTPSTYTITATFGEHGNISPAGTQTYAAGQTAYYMINPDNGYEIDELRIDNAVVDRTTFYVFENIVANHTIHATFRMMTAIEENVENSLMISSDNLLVTVRYEEGANVAIYDINGRMIASETLNGGESRFAMPSAGMYIVRVDAQVRKIVVTE